MRIVQRFVKYRVFVFGKAYNKWVCHSALHFDSSRVCWAYKMSN